MNLSKHVILFIGVLLLHSCVKKDEIRVPENKIEIFLTNKLVLKENCVLLGDYKPYVDSLSAALPNINVKEDLYRMLHFYQFDTITKVRSFKGNFKPTKNDLLDTPIVFDHEIKSYNYKTQEIEIDSLGLKRISENLKYDSLFAGQQFVAKYNENIIFTGYFLSAFSSTTINWHTVEILSIETLKKHIKTNKKIHLSKCYCSKGVTVPEIASNKAFIDAFRKTNRLIE